MKHTHLPTMHDQSTYWKAIVGLEIGMTFDPATRQVMAESFRHAGQPEIAQVIMPCVILEMKR